MKTNRRTRTFARTLFFAVGAVIAVSPATQFDLAAQTSQPSRYTATPDPYFQNQARATVAPQSQPPNRTKPTRVPTKQSAQSETAPDLWMPPKPVVNSPANAGQEFNPPKSSVNWDAPLTHVVPASYHSQLNPLAVPNPIVDPIKTPDSQTIIRERQTTPAANGFAAGNSFANPIQSPGLASAPSANINGNSFQVMSPGTSNDFQAPTANSSSRSAGAFLTDRQSTNSFGAASTDDRFTNTDKTKPGINKVSMTLPGTSVEASVSKIESRQSFEPGRVLALVGGEPIFVGDMLFDVNQVIEQFIGTAPENIKEQRRKELIPQVLPKFVEAKILLLGALRNLPDGVELEKVFAQADTEFNEKQLDNIVKKSGLKSSSEFDAYLRGQGSSLRQFRRKWSQEQLTKFFLSQQLNIASEVTHQEMLDNYRDNLDSYAVPARCRWEEVMIRFDRTSSRAEAKREMVQLGNDIVYGANLSAVAKKSSHGFLASEGGQHDWTSKGALVLDSIDDAIFSLPVGELSDIIESRDGYHVIRVLERTDATKKPFLDAQVEIKKRILDEKRKKAFDEHLQKLKREIPVEYYLNDEVSGG